MGRVRRRLFSPPVALVLSMVLATFVTACTQTSAQQSNTGGGGRRGGGGRGGGRGSGAQPVVVVAATRKDVPVEISAVGNVEASTNIGVRSQVTGVLEEIGFHEGDFVKKGSVLFTIDRRPLEAALEQSRANLVRHGS